MEGREHDDNGDLLLRVSHWRERGLFANYDWNYTCPHLIDARATSPTFEVCAANREPEECVPMREQYGGYVFADLYG
ncbi:MAG: hypothetical protein F4Y08_07555 [Caldilineaceae bacterium SB0662_bin_9]|uniref:Uncharacterized protein n=1 Tax=Caldilineaceae bacterium SB0662_bin_9 TaxID=2605258 RepID=A0A6B1DSI4_9CHLR|nr:hypothetical protein [Caldilineaceae bacterium SB0662_bin_9]